MGGRSLVSLRISTVILSDQSPVDLNYSLRCPHRQVQPHLEVRASTCGFYGDTNI